MTKHLPYHKEFSNAIKQSKCIFHFIAFDKKSKNKFNKLSFEIIEPYRTFCWRCGHSKKYKGDKCNVGNYKNVLPHSKISIIQFMINKKNKHNEMISYI